MIAGNLEQNGYSLTVGTNLSLASNQSTSITSVEVDVVFSSLLNLNLHGVYHFSSRAVANVIDLPGEFFTPFVTTLQLIINDIIPIEALNCPSSTLLECSCLPLASLWLVFMMGI